MIVMELADRNLWDRFHECRTQGLVGIPAPELLGYLDETCEALDLMNIHYQIQHLNIKPQNLFLVHNHIKVADFGLAKDFEGIRATVTGGVTPVYAAPETFEGWISRYCDQYSLAIVYQELLTGVRPFSGTNTRHLLMQHISATPDVSSLPPNERNIIARAFSKKPDERFPTCTEFIKALRKSIASPSSPVSPPAPSISSSVPPNETARTIPNFKTNKSSDTVVGQSLNTPPTISADSPRVKRPSIILKGFAETGDSGQFQRHYFAIRFVAATNAAPQANTSSGITHQRAPAFETGRISGLGIAPPEKIGNGVLMPVYVIGAGRVGLHVLHRLRSYLHERFGHGNFAHWKWLFIDTDVADDFRRHDGE